MSCSDSVQNERYRSGLMACHASAGSSRDTVANSRAHWSAASLAPSRTAATHKAFWARNVLRGGTNTGVDSERGEGQAELRGKARCRRARAGACLLHAEDDRWRANAVAEGVMCRDAGFAGYMGCRGEQTVNPEGIKACGNGSSSLLTLG